MATGQSTAYGGGDETMGTAGTVLEGVAGAGSIYRMAKRGAGSAVVSGLGRSLKPADRDRLSGVAKNLSSKPAITAKMTRIRQKTTRGEDATAEKEELREMIANAGGINRAGPEGDVKVDFLLGEAGGEDIVTRDIAGLEVTGTGTLATSEAANQAYLAAIGHDPTFTGYDTWPDMGKQYVSGAVVGLAGGGAAAAAMTAGVAVLAAAGFAATAPISVPALLIGGALLGGTAAVVMGGKGDPIAKGAGKNLLSALHGKKGLFKDVIQRARKEAGPNATEEDVYELASKVLKKKLKRGDITGEDVKMVEGLLDREGGNEDKIQEFAEAARITEDAELSVDIRESISSDAGELAARTGDKATREALVSLQDAALGVEDAATSAVYQERLRDVVGLAGKEGVDLGDTEFGRLVETASDVATQIASEGGGLTQEEFAKKYLGGDMDYLRNLRGKTTGKKIGKAEAKSLSKKIGAAHIQGTIGAENAAMGELMDQAFGGAEDFEQVATSVSKMAEMVDVIYAHISGDDPRLSGKVAANWTTPKAGN